MKNLGFDLATQSDPRLHRGAALSSISALFEAALVAAACAALEPVLRQESPTYSLPLLSAVLVAIVAATAAFKALGGIDCFVATYALVSDARLRLADHLRKLPMGFFKGTRSGSLGSLLTDEFALYSDVVTHVYFLMVSTIAKALGLAGLLFYLDWRLASAAMVLMPLALATIPWSHRLLNRASDKVAQTKSEAHGRLVEYVQGAATLRGYPAPSVFEARLEEEVRALEAEQMKMELAPAPALFLYQLLAGAGLPLVLLLATHGIERDWFDAPSVVLVGFASLPFYGAMSDLAGQFAMSRFAARTLERIRALLAEVPQPDVGEHHGEVEVGPSEIAVHGVSFGYEDQPALEDIDATFAAGTVTALVGSSGSGKSTLAHLLERLWDVDEGSITLRGTDLRELPLAILRRNIATVFQDVVLFEQSVADNIRLGVPDASMEAVQAAAKAAQAHAFIEGLPQGYDTVLKEGGKDLSGGERQRLSIARALLLDAPVLVLDEATSSVDSENEALVQQALGRLVQGRTVVVVAHRLWTIRNVDQILVLDHGRIVERGTPDALLQREGRYAELWFAQQSKEASS